MPDTAPTPDDLCRDLAADLALCDSAPLGPWVSTHNRTALPAIYSDPVAAPVLAVADRVYNSCERFIVASREGWPAAIRRALAAEAEVARLRRLLAVSNL